MCQKFNDPMAFFRSRSLRYARLLNFTGECIVRGLQPCLEVTNRLDIGIEALWVAEALPVHRFGWSRRSTVVQRQWLLVGLLALGTVGAFWAAYGETSREAALETARHSADQRASLEVGALVAGVDRFRAMPAMLALLPDVHATLKRGSQAAAKRLNATLIALSHETGASVIYAIDAKGVARAASNADRPDSFVGHDFRFRPYFQQAMMAGAGEYFAEGVVTTRPGLFLSRQAGSGAIVVKIEFDGVERLWQADGPLSLVVDRDGVILLTTDPRLRYRVLGALSHQRQAEIRRTQQFGPISLQPAPIKLDGHGGAVDDKGVPYIATVHTLPILGWRHIQLQPKRPVLAAADERVRLATLILALTMGAMVGLSFWSTTRRRRLVAARAALEAEVSRRTAELREANLQLMRESEYRKRIDAQYRAAREEIAQANRLASIGTITTSVAHELNQPVSAIRTGAENAAKLLARGNLGDVAGNLALIVGLTQRIGTITRELLSSGRRGQTELSATPLDHVLDGAILLVSDLYRTSGVSLEVVRHGDLPQLQLRQIRLEQVLVNLLQNALDAVSGRADPRVRVDVMVVGDPGEVRITVADNGPGIPDHLGETIFQPFVTNKPHGTGLGLGISLEIVQEHGGALTMVPSALGGACFEITLPIERRRRS